MSEPKPCPFCGGVDVRVVDGSTFRWRRAECNDCGASAGEIRAITFGAGTRTQWEEIARTDALNEWNRRTP